MRALHNSCDLTLCPSRAVVNDLHEPGFQRRRYWSRGVDTGLFSPARREPSWRAALAVARARTWPPQQRLLLGHYASALDSAGPRVA